MAPEPLIRPFRPEDQRQVVDLWQRCALVVPWNDPIADIERKLAHQPELFLVATVSESVAGTVMAGYEGHRGWINYLAVSPEQQGHGLGRQLMQVAEEALAARGCPKVNLQVRSSNAGAVAFYRRIGYRTDEVISLGKRL